MKLVKSNAILNTIIALSPYPFLAVWNLGAISQILKGGNPFTARFDLWLIPSPPTHCLTMVFFSVIFLYLYLYFYRPLTPIIRLGCSIIIPAFGMFFYEFWWHVGLWIVYRWGIPQFWGAYSLAIFVSIYIIHQKYNILDFSLDNIKMLGIFFLIFLALWVGVLEVEFYQQWLAFDTHGVGFDPHGWLIWFDKGVAMFMWLWIVSENEYPPLTDSQIEVERKQTETIFPFQKYWHRKKIEEVEEEFKFFPQGIVLDFGCGCGDLFPFLNDHSFIVIGMDVGQEVIKYLSHSKEIPLVYADIQYPPFRPNIAEYVVFLDVLEHLPNPKDALKDANLLLCQGGRIIITSPKNNLIWKSVERGWFFLNPKMRFQQHKNFSSQELNSLLTSTGFNILKNKDILFHCLNFVVGVKELECIKESI